MIHWVPRINGGWIISPLTIGLQLGILSQSVITHHTVNTEIENDFLWSSHLCILHCDYWIILYCKHWIPPEQNDHSWGPTWFLLMWNLWIKITWRCFWIEWILGSRTLSEKFQSCWWQAITIAAAMRRCCCMQSSQKQWNMSVQAGSNSQ